MTTNPSTPTGSNSTAVAGDSVVSGIEPIVEQAIDTAAESAVPFLNTPIIKQLFEELVHIFSEAEFKQIALLVTFTIIDGQVDHEETDFSAALTAYKAALAKGDPNEIAQALANFKIAAQNLGHADGSATPK